MILILGEVEFGDEGCSVCFDDSDVIVSAGIAEAGGSDATAAFAGCCPGALGSGA